jgi:hypothetical protein
MMVKGRVVAAFAFSIVLASILLFSSQKEHPAVLTDGGPKFLADEESKLTKELNQAQLRLSAIDQKLGPEAQRLIEEESLKESSQEAKSHEVPTAEASTEAKRVLDKVEEKQVSEEDQLEASLKAKLDAEAQQEQQKLFQQEKERLAHHAADAPQPHARHEEGPRVKSVHIRRADADDSPRAAQSDDSSRSAHAKVELPESLRRELHSAIRKRIDQNLKRDQQKLLQEALEHHIKGKEAAKGQVRILFVCLLFLCLEGRE